MKWIAFVSVGSTTGHRMNRREEARLYLGPDLKLDYGGYLGPDRTPRFDTKAEAIEALQVARRRFRRAGWINTAEKVPE